MTLAVSKLIIQYGTFAALAATFVVPAYATMDTGIAAQRQMFLNAEQAYRLGRMNEYRQLEQSLRQYPLHPYLEFTEIHRQLDQADYKNIYMFLQKHAGSPLALRLQQDWLRTLARKKQWQLLVENYYFTPDVSLQCDFATALFNTKEPQRAYSVLEGVWLSNKALPINCNTPIARWHGDGGLTKDLVWERIRLVMQAGNTNLGMSLASYLEEKDRFWVRMWAKVRREPAYVEEIHSRFQKEDSEVVRWIVGDGVARLASKDGPAAAKLWQQWRTQYAFSSQQRERIERHVALALAKEDPITGQQWLAKFNIDVRDQRAQEVFILTALADQDWEAALGWLDQLSAESKHTDRWRYWRARALEALGQLEEARSIYLINSDTRSYYGFLAADRAGMGYQLDQHPVNYNAADLESVSTLPSIMRARELYLLNRVVDARREWSHAVQRMDKQQMLIAAQLAHEWQWHDRAIMTLIQADYWNDLEKRFPLAHRELIMTQARQQKIEPAWAFAITRQESAFTEDARSHAGAMGLMQLMPATAKQVARSMQIRYNQNDLLDAQTNIRLGVSYLRKVFDRFAGNKVLATAAYNAGDFRVLKWLPKEGSLEADIWVELVPFSETREYCQRVLTYTVIYEQRLGQRPVPLMERMVPIPADLKAVKVPAENSDGSDA